MDPFLDDSYDPSYGANVCQPGRTFLNHAQASDSLSPYSSSTLSAITSASHEILMRSGNVAYASINMLHLQAKCELQAQRYLVTQLQDVINKLTSSQHPHMPSMSIPVPSEGKPEALDVPIAPEPLNEEEYPYVQYWHDEDWFKYTERQKDHGELVPRLGFLTDRDGNLVAESQIKIFTSAAKQAWNELYHHQLDPSSWTKKTPKAASYLAHVLKSKFAEFCYCNRDWKVERFAVIKYPDWCRDAREPGRLTRARPSKRKSRDGDNTNNNRRWKKTKAKSTVPSGMQVIDVVDDIPAESTASLAQSTISSALPSAATVQSPPSPLIVSPSSCLTQQVPLTPAFVPVAITQVLSPPSEAFSTSADIPIHSNAPTLQLNNSNPSSLLPPPMPRDEMLLSQGCQVEAGENSTMTSSGISGSPAIDTALGEQGQQVQPRQINPLANLSIPGPSIQVPIEASTGCAAPFSSKAKAGKLMVASSTVLSARNLFTIDYLKENSPTISEFKTIWDKTPSEVKKKYEALSKDRKAASRLAATATHSKVAD